MSNKVTYYIAFLCCTLLSINVLLAQDASRYEGVRTRLIAYPTADAARARSLERQRYMQPIVEWERLDTRRLTSKFTFPFSWLERQVYLRVEDAYQPYEVYVNGKLAGASRNGFAAAEYNITKLSKEDLNDVELRLKSSDDVNAIECFERDGRLPKVYIISQPRVRVRDIKWSAERGMGGVVNSNFEVVMHNATLGDKLSTLYYELYLNDTIRLGGGKRDVALGKRGVDTMRFGLPIPDSILWSRDNPRHVRLMLKNRVEGRDVEFYDFDVALRELRYANGLFVVNGVEQSIDFQEFSPASSVDDIRNAYDAGVRGIRFTAGSVADEVLDYCDRVGIYVLVTAPVNTSSSGLSRKRGGNPSNDPKWREDFISRALEMYYSVCRHPSLFGFCIADDSANGICLYESYLALKAVVDGRPVFYLDCEGEWNSDHLK